MKTFTPAMQLRKGLKAHITWAEKKRKQEITSALFGVLVIPALVIIYSLIFALSK